MVHAFVPASRLTKRWLPAWVVKHACLPSLWAPREVPLRVSAIPAIPAPTRITCRGPASRHRYPKRRIRAACLSACLSMGILKRVLRSVPSAWRAAAVCWTACWPMPRVWKHASRVTIATSLISTLWLCAKSSGAWKRRAQVRLCCRTVRTHLVHGPIAPSSCSCCRMCWCWPCARMSRASRPLLWRTKARTVHSPS